LAQRAPANAPLTSVAEIRAVREWTEHQVNPLALDGIVTLFDPARNLLVLQDATGAVALELGATAVTVEPGQHVTVMAADSWPYLPELPRYPHRPDRWEWPSMFESASAAPGGYYVARYRGYLYPPTTGQYHFAIASDDSSHLMLGTDADPTSRRGIAWVRGYTRERDWNRTPSQRSEAIFLEAGHPYYIEVLHHQASGPSHLSVAWESADRPLEVIPGRYLSPWIPDPASIGPSTPTQTATASRRGSILREVWDNISVDNPGVLSAPRTFESTLSINGTVVRTLSPGRLPEPVAAHPGQPLPPEDNYRWNEVEGTVGFVSRNGDQLVLEISDGVQTMEAIVPSWRQEPPLGLRGRRVRVVGVGEATWDSAGERVLGRIWLRPTDAIAVTQQAPQPDLSRRTTIAELVAGGSSAFADAAVKVVGRVVKQQGSQLTLSDSGTFAAYTSLNGTEWRQLGASIEIPMGETLYAGLAVNSTSPTVPARAVFSEVAGLSRSPQRLDIGSPRRSGELTIAGNRFQVTGVGGDIWDTPDQFSFVYEPLQGAGEIIARIDDFEAPDPAARAGLMMRESLAPDAQYVDLVQTIQARTKAYNLQWRRRAEGSSARSTSDYTRRDAPPQWLKLQRRFSAIEVVANETATFAPGEMVDVVGYVRTAGGTPTIVDAAVRKLWRELDAAAPNRPWRPLVELARLGDDTRRPGDFDFFRIRGVVTFCDEVAGRRYWAVQDQSAGAFVTARDSSSLFRPRPGSYVEIHSNPGWAPPTNSLFADNLLVLGGATLPKPIRHPAEYLLPRRGEGTWIEVEGIVRSVLADGLMEVKAKGEVFTVAVSDARVARLRDFVDAGARLRGVIAYPNERERLLLVPSSEHLELIDAPPADPFARQPQAIRALGAEMLLNQSRHRTKVAGTVTYVDRGVVFLQDEARGARLELDAPVGIGPGAQVEAVGFPDWGEDDGLVLRHALLRPSAAGHPVPPVDVNPGDVLNASLGARLVRLTAVVSRVQSTSEAETIELEADQRVFRASLPAHFGPIEALPRGSVVQLTGVGISENSLLQWVRTSAGSSAILPLKLLLRSPADIVVLQKPRWWAVKRTLLVVSALTVIIGLAVGWIHILRKRVKQRTAELAATMDQLKKEAQMAATLAERDRLAGEIHDSLEQGFNGLLLQLEATAKLKTCPPEVRSGLTLARNMVSFSRAEVQHAVWELQSPMLENSDLAVAIQKIAGQITPDTLHAAVAVEGTPRRLASVVEHHLLRMAQEALNNTVKHAAAGQVKVTLRYEPAAVVLSVQDDGRGFVPTQVLTGGVGHFGLRSLRSRANKINAAIEIVSAPGQGTLIKARVPTEAA
jgi:signal transduction histidine kinase